MAPEIRIPGVYIEEIPSGTHAITGVATSVAAFVGHSRSGPVDEAMPIGSVAELQGRFGSAPEENLGLAVEAFFDNGGQRALVVGIEDESPTALENGLAALADSEFNLLCLPPSRGADESGGGLGAAGIAAAAALCEERRAFLILDPDPAWTDTDAVIAGRAALVPDSRNAALYYPWLRKPDVPWNVPPSGAVAGVFASTDAARGVWKAPAGMDATLRGALDLSVTLTDVESGELNQAGINSLRSFPASGPLIWGARTLSSDPEWKYVPVRRLFLFLEQSIERGTRWAVFEPNEQTLWNSLRQSVEHFLFSLWREGALQGTRPEEAFFVRCGLDTTVQADIDQGLINLEVGFAPLKPAEFVILQTVVHTGDHARPGSRQLVALQNLAATAADLSGGAGGRHPPGGPALIALFSGPSAARIAAASGVARRLGSALYRIDLRQLMHKYIGETEKNLQRVFERAEAQGAVLLFDEADALFGKRSEVRDGHDRYANTEASYLLTRLREFGGLVILATDQPDEIDSAFRRRSRFHVDLSFE